MDKEDGEMSDDNTMLVDDVKEPISFVEKDCEVVSSSIMLLFYYVIRCLFFFDIIT